MSEERKHRIADTITTELKNSGGRIDPLALAAAIDDALGADTLEADSVAADTKGPPGAGSSPKGVYSRIDEGKTPADLNASNDDGEG